MLFKYTAKNIPLQYRKFNLIVENNKNYYFAHFANKFFTFFENYNLKKKKKTKNRHQEIATTMTILRVFITSKIYFPSSTCWLPEHGPGSRQILLYASLEHVTYEYLMHPIHN